MKKLNVIKYSRQTDGNYEVVIKYKGSNEMYIGVMTKQQLDKYLDIEEE